MKSTLKALVAPAILAFVLAGCEQTASPPVEMPAAQLADTVWVHEVSDLPADPSIRYGQLENGLRYAIMHNETPPNSAAVRLVFNMGSLGETDAQRGLAHFIEHMAFNGTTNVPEGEMVPLLERFGLQFGPDTNAFTGFETVGYQLDLPEADAESIDTALFLMRETASEITMSQEAIDRERGVILSEERVRNTPIRRWNDALRRFRMPNTIIADRDPIGTIEVIENAQRDEFVDYYENFYVPERGMLVVTGSIEVDEIEAKIREQFGDWQGIESPRSDPELGSIAANRPLSVGYFNDPELFTILTIDALKAYTPEVDSADARFRNNLINLGEAILSRRFQTMVSSGTSPFLQAGANHTSEFDIADRASLLAVATPERWQEALTIMEQELRRALEHGFTQNELNEQLANQRTGLQVAADQANTRSTDDLADAIWSSWRSDSVFTTPQSSFDRFQASEADVTVESVNAAFRAAWADTEPLIFLATSLEVEDPENTVREIWDMSQMTPVDPVEDSGASEFAYTDFGPAAEVIERETVGDLGLVRLRFANGVGVTFKQTDFEDESIAVRIDFGRGELEPRPAPAVDLATGWTFAQSGLGQHSADELSRVLAGRAVGTGFAVGSDSFQFASTTTPDDFRTQFDLFTAFMTDPGWREEGLAQFRALAPEIRRNFYSSPSGVLQTEVSRLLRGGDSRFGFPDSEEVAGLSIADMQSFLMPALQRAPLEITIVGDVTEDDVVAVVGSTLGTLPARDAEWPEYADSRILEFPDPVRSPVVLRHNGQDYQAMANTYWPTDDSADIVRARGLTLLNAVYDLKLTERLREEEGFTYSTSSSDFSSDTYTDYGYLWVGVDVQLEDVEATYAAVEELAAELAGGGISEDEMLRARRPLLEQIEESQETNSWWLNRLAQTYFDPARLNRVRSITSDYENLDREDLVSLAEEYLRPQNAWRVTILPRSSD